MKGLPFCDPTDMKTLTLFLVNEEKEMLDVGKNRIHRIPKVLLESFEWRHGDSVARFLALGKAQSHVK